ncbi:MAG: hypothetical protein LBE61_17495 [Burkholderiaceae bacterium]|jgi:membrane protein implicated in regulation of membrane protease activity|nr:hypothetical protein [Burkholderiaceae bacterium]
MVLILIVIAWLYVTVMMAVAEASAANGTLLGAIVTFVLYGLLPLSIIVYIFSTPARKRARKAREALAERQWREDRQASQQASARTPLEGSGVDPDGGGQSPASAEDALVTPIRKES